MVHWNHILLVVVITLFSHVTVYAEKIQAIHRMHDSLSQDSKTEFGDMTAHNLPVLVMNWGSSVLSSNATLQDLTSGRTMEEMNESIPVTLLGYMNKGLLHCFAALLTHWLTGKLTADSLTYWQTDSQTHWMTGKLTGRLADWLTNGPADSLTDWQTDPQTHWLTGKLTRRVTDWLANWLADSLTDWQTYSLTHWQAKWLLDSLTDWQTNSLTYWLTNKLNRWLTVSLTYCSDRQSVSFVSQWLQSLGREN